LFHAVETRTSSPLRVSRDSESLTAIGIKDLFPVGEGAGFAGGSIVSAAVDGMAVAEAVLNQLYGEQDREGRSEEQLISVGFSYWFTRGSISQGEGYVCKLSLSTKQDPGLPSIMRFTFLRVRSYEIWERPAHTASYAPARFDTTSYAPEFDKVPDSRTRPIQKS
jgi:hypothetical protein